MAPSPTDAPLAPPTAEEQLAQRTRELEAVLLAFPDLFFRLDGEGVVLERRAGQAAALRFTDAEVIGRRLRDLLPDDARARFDEAFDRARRSGELAGAEYRVLGEHGWRDWEARIVPLRDGQLVTLVRDITARKDAERRLRAREEQFRRLSENATDVVQIVDRDARIVYTGPSMKRLLGYAPEEIAGTDALSYLHPDDVATATTVLGEMVADPSRTRYVEYRNRHKDGGWRYFEAHVGTLSPGTTDDGFVVNARDVTDRRAAAEALRRSEERYRVLIENTHDIITTLDVEGRITYQSPAVERSLGYRPDEMVGRDAFDLLHPDDYLQVRAAMNVMVGSPGTTGHAEYRYRHRDGHWRRLETFGRTLSPHSADDGLVFNSRDVTTRWEAVEALRQANAEAHAAREEAERANVAKSEFLSRMSHELRTPLNSILGFAQLLQASELTPRGQKGVQHILTAGEHLLTLINEVLDIARIEAGRQQLSIEPVRLVSALQEAVSLVRPLAGRRGVRLYEGYDPGDEVFVRADRQRLVQVLLNLLSNAVKYNRPDGEVRLMASVSPETAGRAARVWVRVEDTGHGIPDDRRHELFVPFSRLGAERTEVEGTGLGLALSHRLVEAMGGALTLERSTPAGSAFRVALLPEENPLQAVVAMAQTSEFAVPARGPAATILYVEDNLANMSLIEQILEARPDWRLVPALQGRLGLELAKSHPPDVVLLDLHLPDISGEDVLRELRARPRTARTPVIVVSADATPKTVERLLQAGATAYLTKPLKVKQFLRTLDGVLTAARDAAPGA
ncbi:PAS domain S-box protein [Roseisolibacter sp. H3M3-2]|uniref:PAS domain S-box protein n=1 Tax=Roseisolibacter sp. H3M3-2 TaxID=3031323 RepID=UPI0023DB20AC|nr:PAS domain S-box protein [Roseisolibacter sp. H3M3-2]MDF1502580.1 PAS domain S-box protein [Roseisolibacter sp. H3M3-2]